MATKLLLIEDVDALGRSGEIVNVRPGYARNFLLPQGMAVVADKKALRQQERLVAEREKKAAEDKRDAEAIASRIQGTTLTTVVKVDQEGHMYGSVAAHEIIELLKEHNQIDLEKKAIQLKHPIKTTGVHTIHVKLKEGVECAFHLKVMSEEGFRTSQEEPQPAAE
jgi:large subunit ribosomal protein L9